MKTFLLIVFKICGLILIVYSLVDIPRNFAIYFGSNSSQGMFFSLLVAVVAVSIPLGVGLLLTFFVKMPKNDFVLKNLNNIPEQVAQRTLGLFLVADGAADFVYEFSRVILASRVSGEFTYAPVTAELLGSILSSIVEAGIGLWLVLGTVRLMKLIQKNEI